MLNKVMMIGRLGGNPEIKYTNSGSAVASFSMALTEYWRDKQGDRQEKTEWVNVVAWERLADQAQSFLQKGSVVYVEGKLQTRSWDDQQGQKKYKTEVVANQFRFLDSRSEKSQAPQQPQENEQNQNPYIEDDTPF